VGVVSLNWYRSSGMKCSEEYDTRVTKIHLDYKKIADIDLSPLSSFHSLRELALDHNHLQSIDLSPIASCTGLRELSLNDNQILSVDLSPLAACSFLNNLDLSNNQLQSIDLMPLSSMSLDSLSLSHNQLQTVDLTPLTSSIELEGLYLGWNQLQTIDLTPLTSCPELKELILLNNQLQYLDLTPLAASTSLYDFSIDETVKSSFWIRIPFYEDMFEEYELDEIGSIPTYERPKEDYQWRVVRDITGGYFVIPLRVQQDVLYALGLKDYGFIDWDLSGVFRFFSPETPHNEVVDKIKGMLIGEIEIAIDEGRATTSLNLEQLSEEHSAIAKRYQKVIELRKSEITDLVIKTTDEKVDLRGLWLTAYGYEVLSSLNMRLYSTHQEFKRVKEAFEKIGFILQTGETGNTPETMSDKLKDCIYWIIENRGRKWIDILY
jgi:hypothetical protein